MLSMANDEHVALLKQGVKAWNEWRDRNPDIRPDLSGADLRAPYVTHARLLRANRVRVNLSHVVLSRANLVRVNLSDVVLSGANLFQAYLVQANLQDADLSGANLGGAHVREANLAKANLFKANLMKADLRSAQLSSANLGGANLHEADLRGAILTLADLTGADLSGARLNWANFNKAHLGGANLSGAKLEYATLVDTDLTGADLTGCRIFGISAWRLKLDGAKQQSLVITPEIVFLEKEEPTVTVDNIEVAQFIFLMLNNQKVRDVINTITSKAVLILGRFTDERKAVLDALREELRKRDYLPILFDFEKPRSRDTDETITLLARMARFIVADISDAKAVLQELRAIVPDLPSVPVQPIILEMQEEPGMFDFYRNRPSFLPVHRYVSQEQLLADLGEKVIRPAELKVLDLRGST
jgi:uncharacterized protein YjbI with pentapeptide repeats